MLPEFERKLRERDFWLVISIYRHPGLRFLCEEEIARRYARRNKQLGCEGCHFPTPYAPVEPTQLMHQELGHEVYGIHTAPVFKRVRPENWMEFYKRYIWWLRLVRKAWMKSH